jgi:hypothetical protein
MVNVTDQGRRMDGHEHDDLLEIEHDDDADALLERVVSRRVPQFLYRW